MNTKFYFAAVLLLFPEIIFSQDQFLEANNSYWNLNFSYGIESSTYRLNSNAGKLFTVEASHIPEKNVGFYASFSTTTFAPETPNLKDGTTKIYQLISGARFYTDNKRFYAGAGLGYFNFQYFNDYNLLALNESKSVLGLNLGIGTRIKTGDSYGFVLNGNVVHTFSHSRSDILFGLSAGFEVNNCKAENYNASSKKFSYGVIMGSVENSYLQKGFSNSDNKSSPGYGVEVTYELSDRFSMVGNFLHMNSEYAYHFLNTQNDIGCGIRYFTGQKELKFFVESLVDMRFQKLASVNIFQTETTFTFTNSLGIGFGAGAEFKLLNNFSGMLKANVIKFDENGSTTGVFGGFRFGI